MQWCWCWCWCCTQHREQQRTDTLHRESVSRGTSTSSRAARRRSRSARSQGTGTGTTRFLCDYARTDHVWARESSPDPRMRARQSRPVHRVPTRPVQQHPAGYKLDARRGPRRSGARGNGDRVSRTLRRHRVDAHRRGSSVSAHLTAAVRSAAASTAQVPASCEHTLRRGERDRNAGRSRRAERSPSGLRGTLRLATPRRGPAALGGRRAHPSRRSRAPGRGAGR